LVRSEAAGNPRAEFSHFGYHPPLLFGYLAGTPELTAGGAALPRLATPVAAGLLAVVAA